MLNKTMIKTLGPLFALLSLTSEGNAQGFVPGDSAIVISGDAPLVDRFEAELKLPAFCRYERFDDTSDVVYGKQGGSLVACKSKDAASGYTAVGEAFLKATHKEAKRRLGLAHTFVQTCPDMQQQKCQTYPCPLRPTKDKKDVLPDYYFGCFQAGNACEQDYACTKK
ncbi:MAG TPA: hypothetical protein VGR01_13700 [Burkholderiales bacterium]|jgi:hypothetical protein|nr:hypothetical protein [Burkholderiales bacterium]